MEKETSPLNFLSSSNLFSWIKKARQIAKEKKGASKQQKILSNALVKIYQDAEVPNNDSEIVKAYTSTFCTLTKKSSIYNDWKTNISSLIYDIKNNNHRNISLADIQDILSIMESFNERRKNPSIETITASKRSYKPQVIEQYKTFNCSGVSLMFSSVMKSLWVESYPIQIYHHVVSLVPLGDKKYRIDPMRWSKDDAIQDISENIERYLAPKNTRFWIIKLNKNIGYRDIGYLYNSIEDADRYINDSNYNSLLKVYEQITKNQKNMELINSWQTYTLKTKFFKEEIDAITIVRLVEQLWWKENLQMKINNSKNDTLDKDIFKENKKTFKNWW